MVQDFSSRDGIVGEVGGEDGAVQDFGRRDGISSDRRCRIRAAQIAARRASRGANFFPSRAVVVIERVGRGIIDHEARGRGGDCISLRGRYTRHQYALVGRFHVEHRARVGAAAVGIDGDLGGEGRGEECQQECNKQVVCAFHCLTIEIVKKVTKQFIKRLLFSYKSNNVPANQVSLAKCFWQNQRIDPCSLD
jgi:hypothetical protein